MSQEVRRELIRQLKKRGYPQKFGELIAENLKTEKQMSRMIGYLHSAGNVKAEEIVDEMLAIKEDASRWMQKKESEYYNRKINAWINRDEHE